MASTEYLCSDVGCTFHDFSNDRITVCPICGKHVVGLSDECDDEAEVSDEEYDGDPYSESDRL